MTGLVRNFSFFNTTLLVLVVLTLTLLTWHHFGMERVLILGSETTHIFAVNDDRTEGGDSVSRLSMANKAHILNCQLRDKYQYPFCGVSIRLAEMPYGVDLSAYDSVRVDIGYTGAAPNMVRFFMRNFENPTSTIDDWQSLKVNEIEMELPPSGKLVIPLKLFHVASWWISERKIPLQFTDTRVDNVSFVELDTGSLATPGDYRFEVRAIEFHGKWISQTHLLMGLVSAWFLFGVIRLVMELLSFSNHLNATRSRIKQLQSINQALKLETQELAGQARTDSLTGALNREGLREYLISRWNDDAQIESGVCVIFADLDHFKSINDQHGHLVGDDVLRQFSQLVQSEIRTSDRLARWGGEEFLIVCSQSQPDQARGLAEKLRSALESASWPQGLQVSCSFGVAACRSGEEFGEMIKRADDALLRAKNKGRNRVEAA